MILGLEKPGLRRHQGRRDRQDLLRRPEPRGHRPEEDRCGRSSPTSSTTSTSARSRCRRAPTSSAFGFKGPDQQKPAGVLSGGERNRLNLALTLKQGGNLLLLDEPTNDLDVETLSSLENALLEFPGCAVVVSHDRWFLDRVATHILAYEGESKWFWFEGNFESYEKNKVERLGAGRGPSAPRHLQEAHPGLSRSWRAHLPLPAALVGHGRVRARQQRGLPPLPGGGADRLPVPAGAGGRPPIVRAAGPSWPATRSTTSGRWSTGTSRWTSSCGSRRSGRRRSPSPTRSRTTDAGLRAGLDGRRAVRPRGGAAAPDHRRGAGVPRGVPGRRGDDAPRGRPSRHDGRCTSPTRGRRRISPPSSARLIHYDRAAAVRLQAGGGRARRVRPAAVLRGARDPYGAARASRTNRLDVRSTSPSPPVNSWSRSTSRRPPSTVPAAVTGPPWAGVLPPRGGWRREPGLPGPDALRGDGRRGGRRIPLPRRGVAAPSAVPGPSSTGSGARSGPGRSATPNCRCGPCTPRSRWASCGRPGDGPGSAPARRCSPAGAWLRLRTPYGSIAVRRAGLGG